MTQADAEILNLGELWVVSGDEFLDGAWRPGAGWPAVGCAAQQTVS